MSGTGIRAGHYHPTPCQWCGRDMGPTSSAGYCSTKCQREAAGAGAADRAAGDRATQEAMREIKAWFSEPAPPPPRLVGCPGCGTPCAADSQFCPSCGKPVPKEMRCAGCKTVNPPGTNFCTACGRGMGDARPAVDPDAIGCGGFVGASLIGFMAGMGALGYLASKGASESSQVAGLWVTGIAVGALAAWKMRRDNRNRRLRGA